jgi:integrase
MIYLDTSAALKLVVAEPETAPGTVDSGARARQAVNLRHAFITAALDAGVPLRDVQEASSHADPRATMRYDRARGGRALPFR